MYTNKKSNKLTIGASLLMSSILMCGSAVKTYAQNDLTPEETQRIEEFLETKPSNGESLILGQHAPLPDENLHKFSGRNNFTSVLESRATKERLDKDYTFTFETAGDNAGATVKVKDWQNLEVYDTASMEQSGMEYPGEKYVFAKQVTFIRQDNNQEFTEHDVILSVDGSTGTRMFDSAWSGRYIFDYPIEEGDTRFTSTVSGTNEMASMGTTGYWELVATVLESIPYSTIVEVDESLKQGEIVETQVGEDGTETGAFRLSIGDDLGGTYLDYDSDVIYSNLKDIFDMSGTHQGTSTTHPWGYSELVNEHAKSPTDRVLKVGIDYTKFVTEDGEELREKEFGVHDKENFDGYEFVETKTEENGDTIHVYKKAVAPEPVQEQELPKQGETNKTTETQSTTVVKDDRVIETGVRTNLFVNLATVVFSGIGLLTLALKKKEKE